MVIKTCKICGEPFDARGSAKCCSPECSKINKKALQDRYEKSEKGKARRDKYNKSEKRKAAQDKYNKSEKGKAARDKYEKSEKGKATRDKYEKSEKGKATRDKYRKSEKGKTTQDKYYENNRDDILKKKMLRHQEIISELCEQYNGDLEQILENIPFRWQVREAKMQVCFNESYCDGIIAKIESTPVCEVTGEKNDLVIHHLYSFNTHPELGNDPANMVRITKAVHKAFHKEYGYGKNTPEQWMEFIKNY